MQETGRKLLLGFIIWTVNCFQSDYCKDMCGIQFAKHCVVFRFSVSLESSICDLSLPTLVLIHTYLLLHSLSHSFSANFRFHFNAHFILQFRIHFSPFCFLDIFMYSFNPVLFNSYKNFLRWRSFILHSTCHTLHLLSHSHRMCIGYQSWFVIVRSRGMFSTQRPSTPTHDFPWLLHENTETST
jgi:hypothetical protein